MRVKLIVSLVLQARLYLLAVLAIVMFYGYVSQSLANLGRIWFILLAVAVVGVVLCCIFAGGRTPLFLFVELEALVYGVSIALRLDAAIIAGVFFLSTARNEEVAAGLVRLSIPYRFAFAVSRALRLVPTMGATGMTSCRSSCSSSSPPCARPTSSPRRWSPGV